MAYLVAKIGSRVVKYPFCIIIWILLSFTLLPVLLILYTIRFIVSKLVPLFNKDVDKVLVTRSAIFASERQEHRHIVAISFVFEGVIELEDVRSKFESRVIQKKTGNGNNLQWPELQQCIVHHLGFPFWKWDRAFNIKNHIRMLEVDPKFEESGLNPQEILDIIEEDLIHKPLPAQLSPWEILIIPNFRDTPTYGSDLDVAGVGTLLIFHADHALGDGTSLAKLFEEFLDGKKSRVSAKAKSGNFISSLWKAIRFYFSLPYNIIVLQNMISKFIWRPNELLTKYNAAVSPTIQLERIKSIRKFTNVSFSTVLLGMIGNALSRFMKEARYQVPETIRCGIPRIVDGHPLTQLRNHITMALAELPMERNSKQLDLIQASLDDCIAAGIPGTYFLLSKLSGGLWTKLNQQGRNSEASRGGIMLTNMSFYEDEKCFGETNKLHSVFVRGKLPSGGNGIVVISTSCKAGVRFLFQIDEGIVPKNQLPAQVFIKFLLQELESMAENCDSV